MIPAIAHILHPLPFTVYHLFYAAYFIYVHASAFSGNTNPGDIMNKNERLLVSMLNTARKTQISIRSILKTAIRTDLRRILHQQLRELEGVVSLAHSIAASRGWELKEISIVSIIAAKLMATLCVLNGKNEARIAAMMIQRSTQGMICGLHGLNRSIQTDPQISTLSQQLVDCTTANIRQLQGFL